MRRGSVVTALIVLAVLIVGVAGTVATMGTKFAVVLGGEGIVTGAATAGKPMYAQLGWVRNTAPWSVEVTSIDVDAVEVSKPVQFFVSSSQAESAPGDGSTPAWAATPATFPVTLPANSIRYFGFAMTPARAKVASFGTVTVRYKGPLPLTFSSSISGVQIAASSPDLPGGLIAQDPAIESTSLDGYVAVLRSVIKSGDLKQLANVMGPGTTEESAAAFLAGLKGFKFTMPLSVTKLTPDGRSQSLLFYTKDPAKDGLKPITATWFDFRWSAKLG